MKQTISLFIFSVMVFILGYSLGAKVGYETAVATGAYIDYNERK